MCASADLGDTENWPRAVALCGLATADAPVQTGAHGRAHAPRATDGACGNITAVHLVDVPQLAKLIAAEGVALAVIRDADCVARAGPLRS